MNPYDFRLSDPTSYRDRRSDLIPPHQPIAPPITSGFGVGAGRGGSVPYGGPGAGARGGIPPVPPTALAAYSAGRSESAVVPPSGGGGGGGYNNSNNNYSSFQPGGVGRGFNVGRGGGSGYNGGVNNGDRGERSNDVGRGGGGYNGRGYDGGKGFDSSVGAGRGSGFVRENCRAQKRKLSNATRYSSHRSRNHRDSLPPFKQSGKLLPPFASPEFTSQSNFQRLPKFGNQIFLTINRGLHLNLGIKDGARSNWGIKASHRAISAGGDSVFASFVRAATPLIRR